MITQQDMKNGPEMVQLVVQPKIVSRSSKTHPEYWKARLVRRSYRNKEGKLVEIPEWHVRIAELKRRQWFNLGTPNQSTAATKARDIYLSLTSQGWDKTLERFKPSPGEKADCCTVGEFIKNIETSSHLRPITIRRYAVKLRKMISDIAGLEDGIKEKTKFSKYDYVNGGRESWRLKVESQKLNILNAESINRWRNEYIAKSNNDPLKRKSAERSAASYLRCIRALFAPDVTLALQVPLPTNPFLGVKIKEPAVMRYHSSIDPELLLISGKRELIKKDSQQYLALCLCLYGGLRRKEADLLTWSQVKLETGELEIRRTIYFEPKTEDSQRNIDLSSEAIEILRDFKAKSESEFVLDGNDPRPNATYEYYRADRTWRKLNEWLRKKGVKDTKAIHMLRKESGSIMASNFGIEDARQHLGHGDIRTTSSHYVSKKARREVIIKNVTDQLNLNKSDVL